MRGVITSIFILCCALLAQAQEGWTSSCLPASPTVLEIMVDACGDEFRSEYVVLKTGSQSFDIRQYALRVSNPTNNAFVGSVKVEYNQLNANALAKLNEAAGMICQYGTVFRDVFSAPYFGIVPQNAKLLIFNNRDSTDVAYLSPNTLRSLCGSKVFVAFGKLSPQSPGASIFRNYPQNGSCGTSGCLRRAEFKFDSTQTTYCQQFTYDIKKLPNLNTSNPPAGFNEGSFLRPGANGAIQYGGGNLTGAGVVCMPPLSMLCQIPAIPGFGDGFWNVLAYDAANNFTDPLFRGFYQTRGEFAINNPNFNVPAGSFEFNTYSDGWDKNSSPSEANANAGALTSYDGCNVRSDSFSILAKRQNFPCGYYALRLVHYNDFMRIRIDPEGDGTWNNDLTFNTPSCNTGCNSAIWQGFLGQKSRIEIYAYDLTGNFQVQLAFLKDNSANPALSIVGASPSLIPCGGGATGLITTQVSGGVPPYTIRWSGPTSIAANTANPTSLSAGFYQAVATDAVGCVDTTSILVEQSNNIVVDAQSDAVVCPGASVTLTGSASGGSGALSFEWIAPNGNVVSNGNNAVINPSVSGVYRLKATDASGCFKTDSVSIRLLPRPNIQVTITPNDTVCNDEIPIIMARGAQSYTWTSFPQIGVSATSPISANADSIRLFALFLPAPTYFFIATGTDANGCTNTGTVSVKIIPLPVVTATPFFDTLCTTDPPRSLQGTPTTGDRWYAISLATNTTCAGCVVGNQFYPSVAGPGKFKIVHEVVDAFGCRNAPSFEVTVKSCFCPNPITVNAGNDTTLCGNGGVVALRGQFQNAGSATWSSSGTGTFANASSANTTYTPSANDRAAGRVVLTLTTSAGAFADCHAARDSVVVNFLANTNATLARSICAGDSFRIKTNWYKNAGTYTDTLRNYLGCDSVVTLNLAILKKDTNILNFKTCNPSAVRRDTQRLVNQFGCDSLVVRIVTLGRRDSISLTRSICQGDSVLFGNNWLKTAGNFTRTLQNTEGCDSVVTLQLTLLPTHAIFLTATSCDPQNVGTRVLRLKNQFGCDSVVTIQTNFASKDSTFIQRRTCNPSEVRRDTQRLVNRRGCDSLVFTTVTLLRRDNINLSRSICRGDSVLFGTNWLKLAGNYTRTLQNTEGCDSVITLALSYLRSDTTRQVRTTCIASEVKTDTVRLRNQLGCDSLVIIATQLSSGTITFNINVSKPISCFGGRDAKINLQNISGGTPQYTILWSNGVSTDSLTSLSAGTYRVSVTDAMGCRKVDSVAVTEPQPIVATLGITPPKCFGDTEGAIRINSVTGGTPPYRFFVNNQAKTVGNLPANVPNVLIGPSSFKIVDQNFCALDTTVFIPEAKERVLEFDSASFQIFLGDSILLNPSAEFAISKIKWTPATQLRCDTCRATLASPTVDTRYVVTATDSLGCTVSGNVLVVVDSKRRVFLPTAFSPNDDGQNDVFTLYSGGEIENITSFSIFNRWGNLLFQRQNIQPNDDKNGWDGRVNGQILEPDVYIYVAIVRFKDGRTATYQGDVTLLR